MSMPLSIINLAPFWSGISGDSFLNCLASLLDRCYERNGGCSICSAYPECLKMWNEACGISAEKGCLGAGKLMKFTRKFSQLRNGAKAAS
jgi:hypothetical protein